MSTVISGIARFLSNDVQALDVVSQNVANMRTAGYRAERLQASFLAGTTVGDAAPALDMADGNLDVTGQPLDLALRGNGFFVVDNAGTELLTRNGQFHLDAERTLVDAAGRPVLGQSGPITLSSDNVHINGAGEVSANGDVVDTLRVQSIADPNGLREVGGGMYAYDGAPAQWLGSIKQGAIEQSNVDGGTEMVRLMELTRHAQSVQRAILAYDQALQTGVNHIGDNS